MDIGSDEARYMINKLTNGDEFYLEPVQLLKLSKILLIMRDNRWFEPIKRLMLLVDKFGVEKFDSFPMSLYKTGSYYKTLEDEKTIKAMQEEGKIPSEH